MSNHKSPYGNPSLTLRDALRSVFADANFVALFPACGQPGLPPWSLALVTILQFRKISPTVKPSDGERLMVWIDVAPDGAVALMSRA